MSGFIKSFNSIIGPKPQAPYSTAKVFYGVVHISGLLGIYPKTSELVSQDVELQTRRTLDNLNMILG